MAARLEGKGQPRRRVGAVHSSPLASWSRSTIARRTGPSCSRTPSRTGGRGLSWAHDVGRDKYQRRVGRPRRL